MGGPITDVPEAIDAALEVRARVGVATEDPLPCVLRLAEEELGVHVVVAKDLPPGTSGFYLPRPDARPLVAVNGAHHVVRQRFTVAHEVGHHVLRHGAAPRVVRAPVPIAPTAAVTAAGPDGPSTPDGSASVEGPTRAADGSTSPDGPTLAGPARAFPASGGSTGGGTAEVASASAGAGGTAEVLVPYRPPRSTDPRERAANAFAAELLCPAAGARAAAATHAAEPGIVDFDLVVRISAAFGLSAASVLARLETAEVLTDPLPRAALQERVVRGEHVSRYGELGLGVLEDELEAIRRAGVLPRLPEGVDGDLLLTVTAPSSPTIAVDPTVRRLRELLGLPA
jgi:Zn-dependent peptidase ImmA (M78 family)